MGKLLAAVCFAMLTMAAPSIAADPPLGMHGIKIAVKDFKRSTAFYTALGMRAGPMHGTVELELNWDEPAQGPIVYLLHDDSGRVQMPPPGGTYIMVTVRDVLSAVDRLKAAGFSDVGKPNVTPRAIILMLKDPDGNWIQMLSPPPAR